MTCDKALLLLLVSAITFDISFLFQACVIHDLCYVTPGVTKDECDDVMVDNINKIYCDNVNRYERQICSARASAARSLLSWTESHFTDAGRERDLCSLSDSYLTQFWKFSVGSFNLI
jgi:hypothetical protein